MVTLDFSIEKRGRTLFKVLPITTYILLGIFILNNYFLFGINMILGLIILPFIFRVEKDRSLRMSYITIPLLILCFLIPVKTVYFLTLVSAITLFIESVYGKLNKLTYCLLFIMSPIFTYLSKTIGFPLRLFLTEAAGGLIHLFDQSVTIYANQIRLGGKVFSVDPACAGLNMISASFICTIFILFYLERKEQKTITFAMMGVAFTILVGLNLLSNLFRIITLIIFRIPAGDPMHEGIGILCFLFYLIWPLFLLLSHFSKYDIENKSERRALKNNYVEALNLFSALVLLILGFVVKQDERYIPKIYLEDCKQSVLPLNIVKLESENSLIYVKHLKGFYSAEHNPAVCWEGSGYTFEKIMKKNIKGTEIYTGIITSDNDKLFTAWWFDNGNLKTADQWTWRWNAFKSGKNFSLVNVSCTSQEKLDECIAKLLSENIFKNKI